MPSRHGALGGGGPAIGVKPAVPRGRALAGVRALRYPPALVRPTAESRARPASASGGPSGPHLRPGRIAARVRRSAISFRASPAANPAGAEREGFALTGRSLLAICLGA